MHTTNFWLKFNHQSTGTTYSKQIRKRFIFIRRWFLYCLFSLYIEQLLFTQTFFGVLLGLTLFPGLIYALYTGKMNLIGRSQFQWILGLHCFVQTCNGSGLLGLHSFYLESFMLLTVAYSWSDLFLLNLFRIFLALVFWADRARLVEFIFELAVVNTVFGVVERLAKEMWVRTSTFKKSFRIILMLLESLPNPLFVLSKSGEILHMNAKARFKAVSVAKSSRVPPITSFRQLVHENYHDKFNALMQDPENSDP